MNKYFIIIIFSIFISRENYIAVIDFENINMNSGTVKALTQRLTTELITLEKFDVLERSDMEKLLDEQKFQYSGCVDTQCVVDIGKILGAKHMVIGSISKIGNSYSIDARMISVETSKAVKSAQYTYNGKIEDLMKYGMKSIAYQLSDLKEKRSFSDYLEQNKKIFIRSGLVLWIIWGLLPPK